MNDIHIIEQGFRSLGYVPSEPIPNTIAHRVLERTCGKRRLRVLLYADFHRVTMEWIMETKMLSPRSIYGRRLNLLEPTERKAALDMDSRVGRILARALKQRS